MTFPATVRVAIRGAVLGAVCVLVFAAGAAHAGVGQEVRGAINASDLRKTQMSLYAADMDTGEVLLDINGDDVMIPASNMKLITTAGALRVLGPDFVFKTELQLQDDQPDAAVLLVKADGDPGFGDAKLLAQHGFDVDMLLTAWVDAVRGAGVHTVKELIIDDRVFDRQYVHPDWPTNQLHKWYCAQVSGLNFYDNCFDIYVKPTNLGRSPVITIFPNSPFIETTNRATTGTTDTFGASRILGSNNLVFHGKVKNQRLTPIHVTIDDPSKYFVMLLTSRLQLAGITVTRSRRAGDSERLVAGRVLHRMQTTLPVVLGRCNKDSQNLFAEALLKRMGNESTGSPGSWGNGAATLRRFLHERLGSRGAGISIADGSGMSRGNKVSARLLVDLMRSMHQDKELGRPYRESLSVAGQDGTLKKRFHQGMKGQVYGKSGYINRVSTLSGYIVYPMGGGDGECSERVIAFSLLFNNFAPPVYLHAIKSVQDQMVRILDRAAAPADVIQLGG